MVIQTQRKESIGDDDELTRRAFAAYFRSSSQGSIPMYPGDTSGVEQLNGHLYVVLRNVNGVLAIFRVRNDGVLRKLRRWPHELRDSN